MTDEDIGRRGTILPIVSEETWQGLHSTHVVGASTPSTTPRQELHFRVGTEMAANPVLCRSVALIISAYTEYLKLSYPNLTIDQTGKLVSRATLGLALYILSRQAELDSLPDLSD